MSKPKKKSKLQKKKDNPNSSYYRRLCDRLVREIVLLRDGKKCVVCNSTRLVGNHHLNSRHFYPMRWCPEAQVTVCPSHHKWSNTMSAHSAPIIFGEWLRLHRPKQYRFVLEHINDKLNKTYKEVADILQQVLNKMRVK